MRAHGQSVILYMLTEIQRAYYQSWGMPVLKVFLGALFTYQVIYLSWLKLEEIEEKHTKDGM